MLLPLVFLFIPASLLLFFIYRTLTSSKDDASPPIISSTSRVPIFGPVIEFGKSPLNTVQRCYKEYGPVFTIPIPTQPITFLVGPQAQEAFCCNNDDTLSPKEAYTFMTSIIGPGVVYDAAKKKRAVQYQTMSHGLRVNRLKSYVGKIERETRTYFDEFWNRDSGEVDLLHALSELIILTASRSLHGDDVRETIFKDLARLFHDLSQGLTPLTVFWPTAPVPVHWKRDKARKEMSALFSKIIKNRKEKGKMHNGSDILSVFMDIKYKDGTSITDDEVTGLLIALLFAGQHTSSISSTWTSFYIAHNPSIMKRIIEEQNTIFQNDDMHSTPLDYDKINQMAFLHNCMKESLRLCPPLVLLMRKALKSFTVNANNKTFLVPKGNMVAICPRVGGCLSTVFDNPETFDPDRFNAERAEDKRYGPYALMGFGGGMHTCMGQTFAYLQVKTILSIMFREYEIEMISDVMPDIDCGAMFVLPKGDCRVRYKGKFRKC